MVIFLGLLAAGMAIPFAIGVPAIVYLVVHGGVPALKGIGLMSWGSMNSFSLTAIPLFILMAEIMQHSGLSFRIYRGLSKLVCVIPGGLLQTNIAGCALFAAISGSSVATAAAIGTVALPQLLQRGYSRPLSAGSLAAGGTLGILIPPSFPMIIYGTFTETSVPKLFMAGVIPGLIMTACFMIYIAIHAKIDPSVAPREAGPRSGLDLLRALAEVVPFVLLILGTLGGLYYGVVTTTEAAVVGCVLSILLGVTMGELTLKSFIQSIFNTIIFSGNILFLILAAYIFSTALSFAGLGEQVTKFIIDLHLSKFEFYLALFVLFTVLGCLIESLGMIVITVPLLYPVLASYGIDPILFGVILVIYVELGQISPPIGINLFVIQSIWDGKLSEVVLGTIPFHLIMFVVLAIVIAFPELSLWLPAQMSR